MYEDDVALVETVALEEKQVAVVKTPARAMQVKEAFVPSRYFGGLESRAWLLEVLPSRVLFAPSISFLDMVDRKTENIVPVPGCYA
jgi:hypothetical protein